MNLPPAGREFVTWPVLAGLPEDVTAVELSVDDGATWATVDVIDGNVRALLAGPDVEDNPDGTVVIPAGRTVVLVRLIDDPEVVIRAAGSIVVE